MKDKCLESVSFPRSGRSLVANALLSTNPIWENVNDGSRCLLKPGKYCFPNMEHTKIPQLKPKGDHDCLLHFNTAHARTPGVPFFLLVRDVRDVICSHASWGMHTVDMPMEDKIRAAAYGGHYLDGIRDVHTAASWMNHTKSMSRAPERICTVRYEDLITDIKGKLSEVFLACGYKVSWGHDLIPFEVLHEINPRYYVKGKPGVWKDLMPKDIAAELTEKFTYWLRQYDYET